MSHPYRARWAAPAPDAGGPADPDAPILHVVLAGIGGLRVAVALAIGERFGAEVTVALAMIAVAAWGWRRAAAGPRDGGAPRRSPPR